jgi:hypothetical protein
MVNDIDKRGKLDGEMFAFKITKNKKVFISWFGKHVTTLKGNKANNFIKSMENIGNKEAQLLMAKATGQFKHGNE